MEVKNRNLLPDDRHFRSRNLVKLFLKPKENIMNLRVFSNKPNNNNNKANNPIAQEMDANPDEHFWAEQYNNNNINNENDGGIDGRRSSD
jgi:condensin complex subunit 2